MEKDSTQRSSTEIKCCELLFLLKSLFVSELGTQNMAFYAFIPLFTWCKPTKKGGVKTTKRGYHFKSCEVFVCLVLGAFLAYQHGGFAPRDWPVLRPVYMEVGDPC